jgi:hypothetical protein
MAAKQPAPAEAGRVWSCGFCGPADGVCHDVHGRCREVWGHPSAPFVPPQVDVSGEVLCACALAGHPKVPAAPARPVVDVPLPDCVA